VDDTSVADLRELPPFANLLVWTMNSPYRMVDTPMPLPGSSWLRTLTVSSPFLQTLLGPSQRFRGCMD